MSAPFTSNGWQPIGTAPCVGRKRLLFMSAAGKMVTGWRLAGTTKVMPEFSGQSRLATHWMPLPEAPVTHKQGEA